MKQDICERLSHLRQFLRKHQLNAFIVPTTDPHASEYTPLRWESRKWVSGFSGSAGTLVITLHSAALWTDSRYYLAASEELEGTDIVLMKDGLEGVPSIAEWIRSQLMVGDVVGIDGMVNTWAIFSGLEAELAESSITINTSFDPFDDIWDGRPSLPKAPIVLHPLEYAGREYKDKIEDLRSELSKQGCQGMLVSALDEVSWLLNLRGSDVHCTPVFVGYVLVLPSEVRLYTPLSKVTAPIEEYLRCNRIEIREYTDLLADLRKIDIHRILLPTTTVVSLCKAFSSKVCLNFAVSPISYLKAVKNEVEQKGFRNAMLRDGLALVKFLRWLLPAVAKGNQTELSVSKKLYELRSEQSLFSDISFNTISAYAHHGAIVHYEPTPETDIPLLPKGLLLLDSGAQFQDATTDITRTIALGELSIEEKNIYTLVLKGHIALTRCRFPKGTTGTQLDLAARYAMWQEGFNYGHGTGHGVGSFLCVHEGPHQIRMNYVPAPFQAGMIITDEPGIYVPNKYGVRIENMLLCKPCMNTEFGEFLKFEPLTLCPIDTTPILLEKLTDEEIKWINEYHQIVKSRLLPYLTDDLDKIWLIDATQPICR